MKKETVWGQTHDYVARARDEAMRDGELMVEAQHRLLPSFSHLCRSPVSLLPRLWAVKRKSEI